MKSLVVCSCGARAWIDANSHGVFECEDTAWKFQSTECARPGINRAELEMLAPSPGWHCGAPGHFNLLSVNADGTGLRVRDLAIYPAHATPAMYDLIDQVANEYK